MRGIHRWAALGLLAAAPVFAQAAPASQPAMAKPVAQALTRGDVEAYFDGLVPYGITHGDIAGAVVVVVKDGQVLFEKGYGFADAKARKPVDPDSTLFRPGSISKLFTWTAVMQLVEQRKLDLDRDISAYLDFPIPQTWPKPITLRDLMTHRPGFEETIKNLIRPGAKNRTPLAQALKDWVPDRIYPPGQVFAYSNYGAALAGYIVQRVSGEPYEKYVADHILTPLGMKHATFEQPLPRSLAADMSKGYQLASQDPQPFEVIDFAPAGGLSVSGGDLARFMIAHLGDGAYGDARILAAKTAKQMHDAQYRPDPNLPGMALGFYHEDRNGHEIIGHGGDTVYFHSDLHLVLDAGTGLLIMVNSAGKPGIGLRQALFQGFVDRYFPAPVVPSPALKTAKADGERIAGHYIISRRSESDFMRAAYVLQQIAITVNTDGTISASGLTDAAGNPKKWQEIAPLRWRELNGDRELIAHLDNGKISEVVTDEFPPIMVLTPAGFWSNAAWNLPLFLAMAVMLTLTVLFWPVKAVLRWRYDRPFALTGRAGWAYRASRLAALVQFATLTGWLVFLVYGSTHLEYFGNASDGVVRGLQIASVVGIVAAAGPLWEARVAIRDAGRPWWTKLTDGLLALASLAFAWFALALHLACTGTHY